MRDTHQIPDYDQAKRDARRVVFWSLAVLLMSLPLVLGFGIEIAALNAFGLGWAAILVWRFRQVRQQRQHRRRRSRGGAS